HGAPPTRSVIPLRYYRGSRDNCSFPCARASVRNPASAKADERAQRAGIAVGLIALVLEGTFAILSLAAVAFITSAFLASQGAVFGRGLLTPAAWAIDPMSGSL